MRKLLALLSLLAYLSWGLPAAGQVFPYFGPANGMLFGTTGSGLTRAATASDLASLISCATSQIVFANSTPALACSANLTWSDSAGALTFGNGSATAMQFAAPGCSGTNTFAFQTIVSGVLGDCGLGFTGSGNTLSGFKFGPFNGAVGTPTLQLTADLVYTATNNPHYQVLDTTTSHNVAYDLRIGSGTITPESWGCFGSTYSGGSPLVGGPSGPSCFLGTTNLGTSASIQPLSLGTFREEMIRLDGNNGTVLIRVPPAGTFGSTPITAATCTNTAGVVACTLGSAANSASSTTLQSGSASANMLLGHTAYGGSAPVVSACGTSPSLDAHATDSSGTITAGSVTATSCTLTFAVAYSSWNHCRVSSQSTIASFAYSYTLSALTITGTSLIGDLIDYHCDGS